MKAQEKAKQLVDKFKKNTRAFNETTGWGDYLYDAKQCALIAVDQIILANPHSNPFNTEVVSTMDYWLEVRKEIEKL
jgi:hypothetical protein